MVWETHGRPRRVQDCVFKLPGSIPSGLSSPFRGSDKLVGAQVLPLDPLNVLLAAVAGLKALP